MPCGEASNQPTSSNDIEGALLKFAKASVPGPVRKLDNKSGPVLILYFNELPAFTGWPDQSFPPAWPPHPP